MGDTRASRPRGYFGIGAEGVSKSANVGALLRTAHAFGASFCFTIGTGWDARQGRQADTADTPLHDGAVLVRNNRVVAAGVILPLSRQGLNRYGTRHLAALGLTERHDQCLCVVVSEETGTLSLARQGRLERPITSSRLHDLLNAALASAPPGAPAGRTVAVDPPEPRG